jgi:hypothetical protein
VPRFVLDAEGVIDGSENSCSVEHIDGFLENILACKKPLWKAVLHAMFEIWHACAVRGKRHGYDCAPTVPEDDVFCIFADQFEDEKT